MKVQVINGEITLRGLPQTGMLKDGSTVSGYNLLPDEILEEEGWVDLNEHKPDYDPETHYLQMVKEVIKHDQVIVVYEAFEIDPKNKLAPSPQEVTDAEYKIKLAETLIELGVL